MAQQYETDFAVGESVFLGPDKCIKAIVVAIIIRSREVFYEVSYFHEGSLYIPTVSHLLLQKVD